MAFRKALRLLKRQRGFTFIEVLIGIALMGLIVAAFMMALATAFKANMLAEIRTTADSLARAQLEYIKAQPYSEDNSYFRFSVIPEGYEIWSLDSGMNEIDGVQTIPVYDGLQKLIVLIKHNDSNILTLEGYKAKISQY